MIAGWESKDGKLHSVNARTNAKGIARFKLTGAGKWFVKMIHMEPAREPGLNRESKWATLTFEIGKRGWRGGYLGRGGIYRCGACDGLVNS